MTDTAIAAVRAVVNGWKEEAERRRRISKVDPAADVLEYCAGELTTQLDQATSAKAYDTVEEFARDVGVTPQTVRTWCRRKLIAAVPTPNGYRIRPGQLPPARRSA
jgi:MerR family regulatory protein